MRVAIVGAGGVGGYYGGLLARGGEEVAFIARGPHLDALRERGLLVESVHGGFHVYPAWATDDPAEVGPVDLAIVAVKSYDLEAAADAARALIGSRTAVLPLLNGLDAAGRLAAVVGAFSVLAGLTHISSTNVAPGVIRQVSRVRRITFGEVDGTVSPRAQQIREVLVACGIEVVLTERIEVALWEKFLFIASIGGVCCLARQPMGMILGTPETRALYTDALREVEAVAHARGVELAPDVVERALDITAGFAPDTKPSMLADLEAGRRLELEAMSGTVVRYGSAVGVHTPVHRAVYAALMPSSGSM